MNKNQVLEETEQTIFRKLVVRCIYLTVQGSHLDMAFELLDLSSELKQAKVGDLSRAIKMVSKIKEGELFNKEGSSKLPTQVHNLEWQIGRSNMKKE